MRKNNIAVILATGRFDNVDSAVITSSTPTYVLMHILFRLMNIFIGLRGVTVMAWRETLKGGKNYKSIERA